MLAAKSYNLSILNLEWYHFQQCLYRHPEALHLLNLVKWSIKRGEELLGIIFVINRRISLKDCFQVVLRQVPQACIEVLESYARWASLPEILLNFQDFMQRCFVCTCGSSYGGSCHTRLWWLIRPNRSYLTRMAYSYWKLLDASWPYLLRCLFLLLLHLLASYYQLLPMVE